MLLFHQLGAGYVAGHEVRSELDPGERELERLSDSVDEQRLCKARYSDQQNVAAREKSRDQVVDGLLLADYATADLRHQGGSSRRKLIEEFGVRGLLHERGS
jgi:hypothetical protein